MSAPNWPPTVPQLPTLLKSFRFVKNPIPIFMANRLKYGNTFSFYLGGIKKSIVTTDPAFIQYILQKNHRNYKKSALQVERLGHFVGNGLLTSNGDYWLQQRRLIQPGFHKNKLAALVGIMQEEIQSFTEQWWKKKEKQPSIEVHHFMMEFAFRIVAKALFSNSVDERLLNELRNNIELIQQFIVKTIRQPYLNPWFKATGIFRKNELIAEASKRIILEIIGDRKNSTGQSDDLLDMLLNARYAETNAPMTEKQILEESLIIFVAGHETSANALSWTLMALCQHPECIEKIRDEMEQSGIKSELTFENLGKLTYLQAVLDESMRLYPPAWITDREAIKDDTFNGYDIPAGALVVPFIYGAHHDGNYWKEPSKFRPERFLKGNITPYSYLPFGGGPRQCIGNNFAYIEMKLILIHLLQHFDLSLVPDQDISPRPLITLQPKNGIYIKFRRRQILQNSAALN